MKIGRMVNLSHKMIPGEEEYRLELKTFNTEELVPGIKRRKDVWYILQEIYMSSHTGTHIEFPYHHYEKGQDAYDFPVEKLIGDAVVLDFSHKKDNEEISLKDIMSNDSIIHEGDIVFIRTDRDKNHGTPTAHNRPYVATNVLEWLIEKKKIRCIGIDATGLEIKGTDYQPNHTLLFKNGIPLIESMTNLDKLTEERFTVFILPLQVKGLDSSPVCIVAIEE